jgi:hypothetical protein
MGFEPRYTPDVEDEITDFALNFPGHLQDAALEQIESHVARLAADPRVALPTRGNSGPSHIFSIRVGQTTHWLRVRFCFTEDERAILIFRFSRLQF